MGSSKRKYRSSSSSSNSSRDSGMKRYNREDRKRSRKSRKDYSPERRSRSTICDCPRCVSKSRSPSHHRRIRFYGTRDNPYKSKVLGVFGLSQATNEARLMEIFSPFGAVEHVTLIYDAKTGNSRGFGFIYYSKIHEATEARKEINGNTIDGRRIRVDFSITKRAHTPTPGIYMGHRDNYERQRSSRRSRSRSSSRRYRRYSRSYSRNRH